MQVLFKATYWLQLWSQLERHGKDKEKIKIACQNRRWWHCKSSTTTNGVPAKGYAGHSASSSHSSRGIFYFLLFVQAVIYATCLVGYTFARSESRYYLPLSIFFKKMVSFSCLKFVSYIGKCSLF
jgi:hypothetical protein